MKDRDTYKILTVFSFFCPLNRFYLGERGVFKRLITLNYLGLGWIADLFYMDKRFDEAMAKRGFTNTNIRNRSEE